MARLNRMFARIATSGGWTLLVLILVSAAAPVYAQSVRPRLRGGPDREQPDPSAASAQPLRPDRPGTTSPCTTSAGAAAASRSPDEPGSTLHAAAAGGRSAGRLHR